VPTFRGFFFCQPELVSGRAIPEITLHRLRFLQALSRPNLNYLLGLLSGPDALLDRPMPEALTPLAVSPAIQRALLGGQGWLGHVYALTQAYERGDWVHTDALAARLGIAVADLPAVYAQAVQWADQIGCP
jgi:c-di-GMP-related signal transduction protein